jgi:hypothetical protein
MMAEVVMNFKIVDDPGLDTKSAGKWRDLVDSVISLPQGKVVEIALDKNERNRAWQALSYKVGRVKPGFRPSMRTREGMTYIMLRKVSE